MQHVTKPVVKHIAWGAGVAAVMFAGLGTVAALWENPLFIRMNPTGGFEIALLLLLSALAGLYVGLPLSTAVWKHPAARILRAGKAMTRIHDYAVV